MNKETGHFSAVLDEASGQASNDPPQVAHSSLYRAETESLKFMELEHFSKRKYVHFLRD